MSVDRQQMLETAERLNKQMADGIPYTWETLEQAKMLCAGIRECKIPNEDSKVEPWLTVSVGGVCAIPREPNRVWDFLSAADTTLYEQKKEQKGKVRFYQGEGKYL